MTSNCYRPQLARIRDVKDEGQGIKTLTVDLDDPESAILNCAPGQFVEVTVFGVGEAPFSVSAVDVDLGTIDLTVAMVGEVSGALHDLDRGQRVGVRGPYGNTFPLRQVEGRDLVFLAGGIGLAPLRFLIRRVMEQRTKFGKILVLYGARRPDLLCFTDDLHVWEGVGDTKVHVTVDTPDDIWTGHVGTVADLMDVVLTGGHEAAVFLCGPSVMMKSAVEKLLAGGCSATDIFVSLERRMECGVGKCGHCNIGPIHVCTDGPVLTYADFAALEEPF